MQIKNAVISGYNSVERFGQTLIYEYLLKRSPEKAREEMAKHVEKVAKGLIAIQKERGLRVLTLKPDR